MALFTREELEKQDLTGRSQMTTILIVRKELIKGVKRFFLVTREGEQKDLKPNEWLVMTFTNDESLRNIIIDVHNWMIDNDYVISAVKNTGFPVYKKDNDFVEWNPSSFDFGGRETNKYKKGMSTASFPLTKNELLHHRDSPIEKFNFDRRSPDMEKVYKYLEK